MTGVRTRNASRRAFRIPVVALCLVVLIVALAACQVRDAGPPASDETVTVGDLSVRGQWVRAGLAGKTTAAYMTIANAGAGPDRLLSVEADIADAVQVHTTRVEGGEVQMVHLAEGLEIPAAGETVLAPEGSHLMLIGLERDLTEGETVDLNLVFEKAGSLVVRAEVLPMTALGPEQGG